MWHEKEIYCQLIRNDDPECNLYDIHPRMGSLEVSTVITSQYPLLKDKLTDILFFSKLLGQMWPNNERVASRAIEYLDELSQHSAPSFGDLNIAGYLKSKYQTNGRFVKL